MTGADWPGKSATQRASLTRMVSGRFFSSEVPFCCGPRQLSQPRAGVAGSARATAALSNRPESQDARAPAGEFNRDRTVRSPALRESAWSLLLLLPIRDVRQRACLAVVSARKREQARRALPQSGTSRLRRGAVASFIAFFGPKSSGNLGRERFFGSPANIR